jgi:hypothetical protein
MFGSCPIAGFNGGADSGGGGGGKFSTATPTRYPADTTLNQIAAEPTRAYCMIVNESETDLFVSLDANVDPSVGIEHASIVLPGGVSAGYDLIGYTGPISFQYPDDDDEIEGYALLTRGYDP